MKSIWITGASSGIGEALAELYAEPGVTLGLVARNFKKLEAVAARCRQAGADVHEFAVDVRSAEDMRIISDRYLTEVGKVDVVIANAGIRAEEDQNYSDPELAGEVMSTNFSGVINTFAPFIPVMKDRRSGHLVAVSSIAAFRGTQNSGLYSASKAAVNVWMESLRLRLMPFDVCVSTMCAGFVDTPMTKDISFEMPGILTAREAACLIDFGIRKKKRMYTFPWQSRIIWGVFRMLPGPLYDTVITYAKKFHPSRKR